jgi:hypothetical protein
MEIRRRSLLHLGRLSGFLAFAYVTQPPACRRLHSQPPPFWLRSVLDRAANSFGVGRRTLVANCLHWMLYVLFHKDLCRLCSDYGPQNMATVRHIVLKLPRRAMGPPKPQSRHRHTYLQ